MELHKLLFYLAVVGNIVLFFYSIRSAIRAVKLFREKSLTSAPLEHLGRVRTFWSCVATPRVARLQRTRNQ